MSRDGQTKTHTHTHTESDRENQTKRIRQRESDRENQTEIIRRGDRPDETTDPGAYPGGAEGGLTPPSTQTYTGRPKRKL